ncbi:MAG: TRAP transporter small permease subunit, partial [Bacteroidota bacterium]
LNGQREHLSMDFLLRKLKPAQQAHRQQVIELAMLFFALVVMVIGGGNLMYTTLYLGQTSPAMNIPLGYVYAIIPASGLLIMFYSVYNIRHYRQLVPGQDR